MDQIDKAIKATRKDGPKWSMGGKPEMISGDAVPSWVKSIPGPKYLLDTDKFKPRAPSWAFKPEPHKKKDLAKSDSAPGKLITTEAIDAGHKASSKQPPKWSLGIKPAMIPGDSVPSWVASIPGPKYDPELDRYKKRAPSYAIGKKLDMVIGGEIPSWTRSIPGPKYTYDTDKFRKRQPTYQIGEKLATEGEIMSKRSPGPIYSGSAIDAVKQAAVDSTKRRTCAPSFGVGPRWQGRMYDMICSGATNRYEVGRYSY